MDYEKQIEIIRDAAKQIEPGKVTVLTGKNGSGKSLLRKALPGAIAAKLGTDPEHTVASVSMESRTQQKHQFGALRSIGIDDPGNPTSLETITNIDNLLQVCNDTNSRFIVIDEPEIGMGEELVAAMTIFLNETFKTLPSGCLGVLIITHNRYMVANLNAEFINIEGMNRQEWLEREIIPTDIEQFKKDSWELYRAINKKISEKND